MAAMIIASVSGLLLPSAVLPQSPGPYLAIVIAGFVVGTIGHTFKQRWLVGVGITLIVLGALALPFAAGIPSDERSPPAEEAIEGGFGE